MNPRRALYRQAKTSDLGLSLGGHAEVRNAAWRRVHSVLWQLLYLRRLQLEQ